MKVHCLLQGAQLALGSLLLVQPVLAQQQPVEPLVPARVAAVVPGQAPDAVGVAVVPSQSTNTPIGCRQSPSHEPWPLLLLNSRILIGQQTLGRFHPQAIESLLVYKKGQVPPGWTTALTSDLLAIKLKRGIRVRSKSLGALKRQLHLKRAVRYEQDGQQLPSDLLRIAADDIGEVSVREAGDTTVIMLTNKPFLPASKQAAAPTGHRQIMIRGVASH